MAAADTKNPLPRPLVCEAERLEYGKLCVSPEGAIEHRAEHGQLGASEGFPSWLAADCIPQQLGIVESASHPDQGPRSPHGTVLWPTAAEGREWALFYRVSQRPEDPSSPGRTYRLARYLVARTPNPTPASLFAAMNSKPLGGTTRAEASKPLSRLQGSDSGNLEVDDEAQGFLAQAIIFLLSGVPVTMVEAIPEAKFFSWVTGLWHLLPDQLKPRLSAGWGVGGYLSGVLGVTYASSHAAHCALYSPTRKEWKNPAVNAAGDGRAFHERRLLPGRMFAEYAFPWPQTDPLPNVRGLKIHERAIRLLSSPPPAPTGRPSFADAATAAAFRWAGLRTIDAWRVRELAAWVEKGKNEDTTVEQRSSFVFRESEREAVEAVVKAWTPDPERLARGDRVLLALLRNDIDGTIRQAIYRIEGDYQPRAALLAAAVATDRKIPAQPVIEALLEAIQAQKAGSLAPAAAELVCRSLDGVLATLDEQALPQLAELVAIEQPPSGVNDWIQANALLLALRLKDVHNGALSASLARREPRASFALAVLNVTRPSADELHIFSSLTEAESIELRAVIEREARRKTIPKNKQDALFFWMEKFRVLTKHPFQALQRRERVRASHLIEEVEQGNLPESIIKQLAEVALERWHEFFDSFMSHPDKWSTLAWHWPPDAAEVLLPEAPRKDGELLRNLRSYPASAVENLILSCCERELSSHARRLLWRWADCAVSPCEDGVVGFVWSLRSGRPHWGSKPSEKASAAIVSLAREAPAIDPSLPSKAADIWAKSHCRWQILLLLESFPSVRFTPTTLQISELALRHPPMHGRIQKWIKQNPQYQGTPLEWASKEFHGLVYPGTAPLRFDERPAPIYWALFRGVPPERQGPLREALQVFAQTDRARSELCHEYLNGQSERTRAALRVLEEFALPCMGKPPYSENHAMAVLGGMVEDLIYRPPQQRVLRQEWEGESFQMSQTGVSRNGAASYQISGWMFALVRHLLREPEVLREVQRWLASGSNRRLWGGA